MNTFLPLFSILLVSPADMSQRPDCSDVCNHIPQPTERMHRLSDSVKFKGWEARCRGDKCAVLKENLGKFQIPGENENSTKIVNVNIKEIEIINMKLKENRLDMSMWLGMRWQDESLFLCDCSQPVKSGGSVDLNLQDRIWVPDFNLVEKVRMERRNRKHFSGFHIEQKEGGVAQVSYSLDVKSTIRCRINTTFYPFDSNLCLVRFESYTHSPQTLSFKMDSFEGDPKTDEGVQVYIRPLCVEETGAEVFENGTVDGSVLMSDGFKVIVTRKGMHMRDMYIFTANIFIVTAFLATLLPSTPPSWLSVDKSGPLTEATISTIYILFDLYKYTPFNNFGKNVLIEFVEVTNYIVYSKAIVYVLVMFVMRVRQIQSTAGRKVLGQQGDEGGEDEVPSAVCVGLNSEGELVMLATQLTKGYSGDIFVANMVNKIAGTILLISYLMYAKFFWMNMEVEARSLSYHNRGIGNCTCLVPCPPSF